MPVSSTNQDERTLHFSSELSKENVFWPNASSPSRDCTDNFLLALTQVAFLQKGILQHKLQYFSIYIQS
jgi:hypothetical protein